MVISLGWLSPATSCGLPAAQTTRAGSRCLLGLAPTGGCRAAPVARRAVGSYPTFSPLPFGEKGRSVFCGPFRRLAAPRRYLAVCPTELGLSSARPSSRRTATIAPYRLPRGKLLTGRVGASLPHQAPQQARQAVRGEPPAGRPHAAARRHRRVGVEPKAVVLLEHSLAQPGRVARREDRWCELGGVHGVDASRPVKPEQLPRGELRGEQQQGAIRHREAAQQAEREPIG